MPAAISVGLACGRAANREEHAQGDEEITEDFRVGCEHISHQNISELAIFCERNASDRYTLECCKKSIAATLRKRADWYKKEERKEGKIGYGKPIIGYHKIRYAVGQGPEDE